MSQAQKDLIYSIYNGVPINVIECLLSKIDNVNFGTVANYNGNNNEINPLLALTQSYHLSSSEILKLLIEKGIDVNTKSSISGRNALMLFAQASNIPCVNLLLQHGANLDDKCDDGKDVGYYASLSHNSTIINLIANHRHSKNISGCINYMSDNKSLHFIKIIIENTNPSADELWEILLFALNNKQVYLPTINNYMTEHNIPFSIFDSKLDDFIKNNKLSVHVLSFLIMNKIKFDVDKLKLSEDNATGDAIIELIRNLHEKTEKCLLLQKEKHELVLEYEEELASVKKDFQETVMNNDSIYRDIIERLKSDHKWNIEEVKNDSIYEIEKLEFDISKLEDTIEDQNIELDSYKVEVHTLEARIAELELGEILLKNKLNLKQQECDELRYEINCTEQKNISLHNSFVEEKAVMQTLINELIQ